jgi:hypothetical protein
MRTWACVDVTMRDFSRSAFRYAHGPLAAKSDSRDFINCHQSGLGPFMIQVEVLDESVSWPFTIPPGRSNHDGAPPRVAELCVNAKYWHLIGWKDCSSNSIGIARKNQVISIDVENIEALSVCFMRRAKGPGFVSFEVRMLENRRSVVLFAADHFNEDALLWLQSNANRLAALFGMPITINDCGSDY